MDEENIEVWGVFISAATQFEWSGGQLSRPVGIKYSEVDRVRRIHGVEDSRQFWDRIGVLEGEVLKVLREHAEREINKSGG